MTQAFPLKWPKGRPRAKHRYDSAFKVKPRQAYDEMINELALFGAKNVVVSTNIPLRRDGTPYTDGLDDPLTDPGVAVYFSRGKQAICLPCDTYRTPWENCRAIGKAVEALRSMERHGAGQILEQAFAGFAALPHPDEKPWHVILGVDAAANRAEIDAAYKVRARELAQRDDQAQLQELNVARDKARQELGE